MEKILTAEQVATLCKVRVGKAYQIIRELNEELKKEGYITIRGRINKDYLLKRLGIEEVA
ncbi:transcriptional regulator [Fusobacterium perfoetens]|uniref:transcriptional regulator n=1 Tax=Fusobacterium perfoetens TaxID=852 RepID=UPI001F456C6F|nr:transcriptional regulator [Fusobacterium perfoetens]MCF2613071.1 transcriptional regulator [Fusobacterium perfoetens]